MSTTPIQRGAEALAILWRDENAAGGFGPTDIQTTRAVFASIDRDELKRVLDESDPEGGVSDVMGLDFWNDQSDAIIAWLMGGGE